MKLRLAWSGTSIVAAIVVSGVDGFTWDWDDVACAAAALRTVPGAPFLHAVSAALWHAVSSSEPDIAFEACQNSTGSIAVVASSAFSRSGS